MTASTAALRRGVTPRFWPEIKTLIFVIGWHIVAPVSLVARMRAIVLPTSTSMSGITVARV
jgi:hypothetical protein